MSFANSRKGARLRRGKSRRYSGARSVGSGVSRFAVRVAAGAVSVSSMIGCGGYAISATDGSVFARSDDARGQLTSALIASGSRDLPCSTQLEVRRLDAERQYLVSGCGSQVLYDVETPTIGTRRVELLSRASDPALGEHPALAAADAHSQPTRAGSAPRSASNRPQL
jgi:hypothetical protein